MERETPENSHHKDSLLDGIIHFSLGNKLLVFVFVVLMVLWGLMVAPFDWKFSWLPGDPVPVDAIPDIGENQQIVFTEWMGRSPQDVEDQVTYPLTIALLGIPGVKTIRSSSMFGFSSIYVIFKESVDFYWSRSRILEKLSSLPPGTLPPDAKPVLGPDATALGQVFWYTLEGLDRNGVPTGGWDLHELRSIQDWYVRYALQSADGVSEVASVGGFVKEYQIDVDPDAMRAYKVSLHQVIEAVRKSNLDVGARTIEVNRVEYVVRGIGFIQAIEDLENTVVAVNDNVPVYLSNIAHISLGPALRRGALDKEGAEAVGGVVVVRYGQNPLEAINNVKKKIKEISPALPSKTLPDGTVSKVTIVPFYDRTGLIYETLDTLQEALILEILITIIVVLVMVRHLKSALLISGLLPLAVLMAFIAMKLFGVDANIVALSGIAIAIGTMVDMGIIVSENILKRLSEEKENPDTFSIVYSAAREVGTAVLTAISTTVISFLPVFTMQAAEGKLFKPLAFTKTFALIASAIVALTIIPPLAHLLLPKRKPRWYQRHILPGGLLIIGIIVMVSVKWWLGAIIIAYAVYRLIERLLPKIGLRIASIAIDATAVTLVAWLLASRWLPLGPQNGILLNFIFVGIIIAIVLVGMRGFITIYPQALRWCLDHKLLFLSMPMLILFLGLLIWLGFPKVFNWLPSSWISAEPLSVVAHKFPGLSKEFMPPLDEGSFLFMPTTMPHAAISEALDILQKQDMAIKDIPEVDSVVGKIGRVESPLDPAPVSMIETVINYLPQFLADEHGNLLTFEFDPDEIDYFRDALGNPLPAPDGEPYLVQGKFLRDKHGKLIPKRGGMPFRLWRPMLDPDLNPGREAWKGIQHPDDIWREIVDAAQLPGVTSAPKLQPIAARLVMLQSGMRAPMGIKVKGKDLASIEKAGFILEEKLKEVPAIDADTVIADRIVGKPYLEIHIDRRAIARYGIKLSSVQEVIETAIGGKTITTTVEGRERYTVRVRYLRELRDNLKDLGRILVPSPSGAQIPLVQLTEIKYVRGPQVIKSEDADLVGYVLFDMKPGYSEVDVVIQAADYLENLNRKGELNLGEGISYQFTGTYESQVRAEKRLMVVVPLALMIIFLLLYLQFRSIPITLFVFSGIAVAWSGGFIMIWLYGQPWFLDLSLWGVSMRELFQVHTMNLSVAVWVGFLALFGIATDDGVIMATYLNQVFDRRKPTGKELIRQAVIEAGKRRVRPCLMTIATTMLALLPVITSQGRGSDIMVPMAIPSFGGMTFALITIFIVPVLYSSYHEMMDKLK